MNSYHLSVIIPAYNEEARIGASLENIIQYLKAQSYSAEIILADDGSKDQTVSIAQNILRSFPHQILAAPANAGKGDAVRRGILAANGAYLLFTDADLSTPIEEVARFLQIHATGADLVIGSRALPDSNVEIRQDMKREAMGRIFNFFATLLAFKGIADSQCGFKSFTRQAGRDLFSRQKLDGFSFDVEILYLAQKHGYKIVEEPVTWRNSTQTRVRLLTDPLAMFFDLLKIRWLHRHDPPTSARKSKS